MDSLQPQFRTEKWTFLLDGRVVEWFYENGNSHRLHVDHFRMHGEMDGDDMKIRWGTELSGTIVNGGRGVVRASQIGEFKDFVGMAISHRTPA